MDLKGRNFLTLKDYTPQEITYLLELSAKYKAEKKAGVQEPVRTGKNIALIFEKTSTRTRCSFEVAAHDLGMQCTYLDPSGSQIGKKESIRDTARVLGRMYDGIEYRGFGQEIVEELAKYAGVPVWNGLTNEYHPTQMLADMLTIQEHLGELKGKKLTYMGDARYNMGNSLMIVCAKLGLHFTACTSKEYFPDAALVAECEEYAKASGATITLTEDVAEGAKDADVIYTDVWVSMGEPDAVWAERIRALLPYQVNKKVMTYAKNSAIFMHCLPAFHDLDTKIGKEIHEKFGLDAMEVTDEVLRLSLQQPWDWSMKRIKKMKEQDIRLALLFCMLTALAADILCVLFLLGILQSRWVLNVISALAILLHTALALFGFVQKRTVVVWVSLLLLIGYTGNFIYYNLEWLKGLISL